MTPEILARCVRPVAWEAGERDQRRAYTLLGELVVTFFGGRWHHAGLPCAGMLEAQAAAQADYTARILAALDLDALRAEVEAMVRAEREALLPWARVGYWAMMERPDYGDLSGFDLQEQAIEEGVLVEVPGGFDPDIHRDDGWGAERGDTWYVLRDVPAAILAREGGGA